VQTDVPNSLLALPFLDHATVPLGVLAVPLSLSVMVVLQLIEPLTGPLVGLQLTPVAVLRPFTLMVDLPLALL
jgi:hypothetical protein